MNTTRQDVERTSKAQDGSENIRCNLCGADETKVVFVKEDNKIVACNQCGLIYVNPRLADPNPANIYDSSYFDYYIVTSQANKKTFDRRLQLIETYYPQKGKILDVGCSIGDFMEIAKLRGWQAVGIDIADAYADDIRSRLELPVLIGDYAVAEIAPESFDVVNMGDSIEHMLDPMAAVLKTYTIMKNGGIGYLRAPDIYAPSPRLAGAKWIQLKPREHLYYFTRRTIRQMLEKAGFEILKIGTSGTYCTINILRNRLTHYYHATKTMKLLDFIAETLKLGEVSFYLDVFEELQVVFRKPIKK